MYNEKSENLWWEANIDYFFKNQNIFTITDKTAEELEEECIYMAGNSLGIRPKKAEDYMNLVMNQWRDQ